MDLVLVAARGEICAVPHVDSSAALALESATQTTQCIYVLIRLLLGGPQRQVELLLARVHRSRLLRATAGHLGAMILIVLLDRFHSVVGPECRTGAQALSSVLQGRTGLRRQRLSVLGVLCAIQRFPEELVVHGSQMGG